jgi:N-acetylneuraminic acid mutarotase
MNSRLSAAIVFTFAFGATACQDTVPTQPEPAGDASLAEPSFATAANTWTKKAKIPTRRAQLAAGVVGGTSGPAVLYAFGGRAATGSLDKVEAYNFATDSWTAKTRMPARLTKTNGVGVMGGWLYISGGQVFPNNDVDFGQVVRTLYVYKPSSSTWSRKADMPFNTSDGITGVINDKMYVLAGDCVNQDDSECGGDRRLYRYDRATDTWDASLPPCPDAHVGGVGGVINGKFYVTGGRAGSSGELKLHVYDPATNLWTTKRSLPSPQPGAAGAVAHNKLHVIGGRKLDGTLLRTVRVYDPVTNNWTTAAPMPTPRDDLAAAQATLNGQSYILAVAGSGPTGLTNVNEAYAP